MLFNSYEFILIFLPLVFAVFFILNMKKLVTASRAWLVMASLFFYSWWNVRYLPLIVGSILFNFVVGNLLGRISRRQDAGKIPAEMTSFYRRLALTVGIAGNVLLLGYYKYADFFLSSMKSLTGWNVPLMEMILPLGISFFTFTQIGYLVDVYRGAARERNIMNYGLFVTFFPRLFVGPIVRYREMMPQFAVSQSGTMNGKNIALGLFLFSIGLFKKVIIADEFAIWATAGFDGAKTLTFLQAWITSLSYTFQIYFDFSGYTDMALGAALLFNIRLPINFDSPYKSLDIQEFWRRWHMTLSRFLRDYIYIPLGGNRSGQVRMCFNFMITFLVGGLWHGAGWNFVFWGFLHGIAIISAVLWKRKFSMNKVLAWFITFNFINATWVFFRAKSWDDAMKVLKGMCGLTEIRLPKFLSGIHVLEKWGIEFGENLTLLKADDHTGWVIGGAVLAVVLLKNSNDMVKRFQPGWKTVLFSAVIMTCALFGLNRVTQFLYFQF